MTKVEACIEVLYETIKKAPQSFSIEGDGIQYLGKELLLKDGEVIIGQEDKIYSADRKLRNRLISTHPELKKLLPYSKEDALRKVQKQLLIDIDVFKNNLIGSFPANRENTKNSDKRPADADSQTKFPAEKKVSTIGRNGVVYNNSGSTISETLRWASTSVFWGLRKVSSVFTPFFTFKLNTAGRNNADSVFDLASNQQLKYAVALERIFTNKNNMTEIREALQQLSGSDQYRILEIYQKMKPNDPHKILTNLFSFQLSCKQKFKLIKVLFQQLEHLDPDDYQFRSHILPSLSERSSEKVTLESDLKLIFDLIAEECPELAEGLIPVLEKIRKTFTGYAEPDGTLTPRNHDAFSHHADQLLYLVAAASSNRIDTDDISRLTSFIKQVFLSNDKNINSFDLDHIARELAFLSGKPNALDYSHYIDTAARILLLSADEDDDYLKHKHLSAINCCSLFEGEPLARCFDALKTTIKNVTPKFSDLLQQEVKNIADIVSDQILSGSLPPDSKGQQVKEKFHRLLLVIAACKDAENGIDAIKIERFVKAIMVHGGKQNIIYLVKGLACLVTSSAEVQSIICQPEVVGGKHTLLAPLGLLPLLKNNSISKHALETICQNLRKHSTIRKKIKDGKIFHQWFVTLNKLVCYEPLKEYSIYQTLLALTSPSETALYDKLSAIDLAITAKTGSCKIFAQSLKEDRGLTDDPIEIIAQKGYYALSRHKESPYFPWLSKQRYAPLYDIYQHTVSTNNGNVLSSSEKGELLQLMEEFLETSSLNTFVKSRQSPSRNPHLAALYQQRPNFQQGWGKNFKGFSQNIESQLKSNQTLQLTEDPWDLFVSGFEHNTCQSPDAELSYSRALMSYVMDGRNAMIVKKNTHGCSIARAWLRILFDSSNTPVLLMEDIHSKNNSDPPLIMSAAREIAAEMKLVLYEKYCEGERDVVCNNSGSTISEALRWASTSVLWGLRKVSSVFTPFFTFKLNTAGERAEALKELEGRAPFDYLRNSSAGRCVKRSPEIFITAVKVQAKTGSDLQKSQSDLTAPH